MFNENENIENEAPNLFGINKQNSFKVPKNYFEDLENSIAKKIIDKQSILNELKGKNSFNVPNEFFNELTTQIENKIKPKGKTITLFSIKKIAYAASIIGIITASVFIYNNQNKEIETNLLAAATSFEKINVTDFFNEMVETEIEIAGIDFEEESLELNNETDFNILDEEFEIDPTELIELDSEFDLFE